MNRIRRLVRAATKRCIVMSALKVALVVGTALNLINQWEYLLGGKGIMIGHLLLNYLVPFCVATYSAATTAVMECDFAPHEEKNRLPEV